MFPSIHPSPYNNEITKICQSELLRLRTRKPNSINFCDYLKKRNIPGLLWRVNVSKTRNDSPKGIILTHDVVSLARPDCIEGL